MDEMQIFLKEIDLSLRKILSHLEEAGVLEIELEDDFYWAIDSRELYDPYSEPTDFSLGQLSSDLESLKRVLGEESEPLAFDLIALSALLRYMGTKIAV